MKKSQIFLGKKGKIFGPYTKVEYEQMYASGQLENYTWIWNEEAQSWKTLEMPPAPPPTSTQNSEHSSKLNWQQVRALCFDRFTLASGKLECVTENGCELISEDHESGIKFPLDKRIELSLFDGLSQKSTTLSVQIAKVEYRNHSWVYRLKWNGVPQILTQAA